MEIARGGEYGGNPTSAPPRSEGVASRSNDVARVLRDANGQRYKCRPAGGSLRCEGRVEFGLHRVAEAWEDEPATTRSPFGDTISDRGRAWLEPRTVIELRALPRPAGGSLRHATALRVLWRD